VDDSVDLLPTAAIAALLLAAATWVAPSAAAGAPEGCFTDDPVPEADVGLVLDRSGSMSGEKLDAAQTGARNLALLLRDTDHSGLVSYAYSATLDKSLGPDHQATVDAIDSLSAGGGTATGDAINLSHTDFQEAGRSDVRQAMVLLTDGKTNTGSDPVAQAQEAKDAGIEVYAVGIGDDVDEDALLNISSDPNSTYYHNPSTENVTDAFGTIATDLTGVNDTADPTVSLRRPEPGHLYLKGVDQGPGTGTYTDRATLLGNASFVAEAGDDCYLEAVNLTVPGTGFSYAENATNVTTPAFPTTETTPGNYTLDALARDWVGNTSTDATGLHVADPDPPTFTAGPCVTGETFHRFAGTPLSFPVEAKSPYDEALVDLSLTSAPAGVTLSGDLPANPAEATIEWPSPTQGTYTVGVVANDDLGGQAHCTIDIVVEEPDASAHVSGLWAGVPVPQTVAYRSQGVDVADDGQEDHRQVRVEPDGLPLEAGGLREAGSSTSDGPVAAASGVSRTAEVRLLDGRVVLEDLVHEAEVRWDAEAGEGEVVREVRQVGNLTVDGTPVPVDDASGPVEVPLPEGGVLHLFERNVTEADDGIVYRSALAHVHLEGPYGAAEALVGEIRLEATDELGDEAPATPRTTWEQDDAGSRRDAGPDRAGAVAIEPGIHDGSVPRDDRVDVYAIDLAHGEKITASLHPAHRAHLQGGAVSADGASPPDVSPLEADADLGDMEMQLVDPDGDHRDRADPGGRAPGAIEINADETGTWLLYVAREVFFDRNPARNYSLEAKVTPVPLLPQNDALGGGDAPGACDPSDAGIPSIQDGQWPGVLKEDDWTDVYRFHADVGDLVTAALKPGETADGVDMALTLHDRSCSVIDRSDIGLVAQKGKPEAVVELPSDYTGDYFLGIERLNGVGNHHVTLSVRDPMPSLPANDALTGEDAPEDRGDADEAPPVAFQGELPEGDPGDAYLLPLTEGNRTAVTVEMSAFSEIEVRLFAPDGAVLSEDLSLLDGTWVYEFEPETTGLYGLEIRPKVGGGDYLVTYPQAPTEPLEEIPFSPSASPPTG
jgi:uncharacterized protein YegL